MSANSKVLSFPAAKPRRREYELAFLPAALEITETPPSPVGRAIGFTLIALFCLAVAWASIGTVDIVTTAKGKIIPNGRTKLIQPLEAGVVRAIHVHDGQGVKAGDVLIELDRTVSEAERDRLKSDLITTELEIARLRAALVGGENLVSAFHPPEGAPKTLVEMHQRFLISQNAEHVAKLAALDHQQSQKEAERDSIAATMAKLKATIPLMEKRVGIRKGLYEKGLGSIITYLQEYQDLVTQQQDLVVQTARLREAEAAVSAVIKTKEQALQEYRRTVFDELAKAEQKAAGLAKDLLKAEQRTKLQTLSAPVDGVVQQLAVHTIGGVVTPAQVILVLVPQDSRLEIEAMIPNRDIGFVRAGQEAEIKIDTFNFTRYGLIHGHVISVSQDAISRDKPQERSSDKSIGAESASSEPAGQDLVYAARVALDRAKMEVDGKPVNLSPGMAVTVEIKTGSRRIISYLLSPINKYKQEALRER